METDKRDKFGRFAKGRKVVPTTKGRLGKRPWNYLDGRSNHPISRKKIKGKQIAHVVYCLEPENLSYVPKGFVIHHIDTNPSNNDPTNLFLMDDRDHRGLHNTLSKAMLGSAFR